MVGMEIIIAGSVTKRVTPQGRWGAFAGVTTTRAAKSRMSVGTAQLSAGGAEALSATSGRGFVVDPGSVFARDLDAAGGSGSGYHDGRDGERTDGVEANPRPGRGRAPVSSGSLER